MDDDGMRIDELEELLDRARRRGPPAEVHLLGADLPEPGRGDALGASGGGGWSRSPASASCCVVEDNPYGLLRYEGEPRRAALLARRRRLRALPRHVLEDPLPRDPARLALRAAAGDGEGRARQAGLRPLHLDPDPVLRRTSTSARATGATTSPSLTGSTARAATRCSTRSSATSRGRRPGRARGRPLRLGDAARLHRHHRPAGEGAARQRRLRPRRRRLRRRARRRPRCGSTSPPRPRTRSARASGGSARVDRRAGRALRDDDRRAPSRCRRPTSRRPPGDVLPVPGGTR